jgi:uncharacterized protein
VSTASVIDVCGVHFDRAGWQAYLRGFARHAPRYLHKFSARFCAIAGADHGRFCALLAADAVAAADYLVECGGGFDRQFEDIAQEMEREQVTHVVLQGVQWPDRDGRSVNDRIAAWAQRAPQRLSAWAGISLRDPEGAARELERCVHDLGMRGATLIPFWDGVPASERACAPIYRKLDQLRVPVWIHTGNNFSDRVSLDTSHWLHIDRVAVEFPRIKIIIGHAGWPWVGECLLLCQRHRNVFLEFSTHRPAHMTRVGSMWEPLLAQAAGEIRHRVMFGSANWVTTKTVAQLADETRALPIPPEVAELWLCGNARRELAI